MLNPKGRNIMIKLLVVDDIEQNLYMLNVLLQGYGYDVALAGNGLEALEKARQDPPDLIITDILMPVMDGFTLCRQWKQDQQLKTIPFVFYTATYTDPKDEMFALGLGAERFIIKPTEPEKFIEILQEVLDQCKRGRLVSSREPIEEEAVYLKQYNEALIHKLEDKVAQLEETNQLLAREIKERKQVEKILRESESLKGAILRSSLDCIITVDRHGKIIEFNPAAEKAFGCSRNKAIGKDLSAMIIPPPSKDSRHHEWEYGWYAKEDSHKIEAEGVRADGSKFPVELTVTQTASEGELIFVAFLHDITNRRKVEKEKKALETQLIQAQKMEAVGTLAGGIAHDFNNILSAVIGYTEMALSNAEKESLSERYLQGVIEAGERAKDLVKQILTFSRQTEQERKPIQVKVIAKEALKFLRASLPATIDIHQDLKSDSLVMGDPTQIHQVLMNLCTNAGHAMKAKGGILKVCLSDVELDSHFIAQHPGMISGPHLQLTISDTGDGMTADKIERIFEPYFTTKSKEEGTGLGLSVVHGITKSCGGTVTVDSTPEKGSTFNVFLPIIEKEMRAEDAAEVLLPIGNEKILFIDDEPTLVEIGKELLARLGYQVDIRSAGAEALELFKSQPDRYDLVITDMTMPGMMGDELAGELLKIRDDIPIILCTGFSQQITEKKARQMGIKAFLMKPLIMQDLAATIRKVLDKH